MINFFETLFEARERKFQQEKLFRGESVDLVARITTDGVLDQLSDYQISGVYQPTDNLSGPFYPMDAEIVDGKAILHWTGDNDFGKTSYNVWGLLTKDGKAAYPVCWRLNMAHSPSYPLSSVDPIPRTIDFSQYDLLNAPWLPLSGGVMDADATIGFPISGDVQNRIGKNGFEKIEETTTVTEALSGWCWHSILDPVPDYEIQWYSESDLANWDEQQQGVLRPDQNPRLRLCATKPEETITEISSIAKFSLPNDEEGDRTIATREWTQEKAIDKLDDYLPLSGGVINGDFAVSGVLSVDSKDVNFGLNNTRSDTSVGNRGTGLIVGNDNIHNNASGTTGKAIDIGFNNQLLQTSDTIVVGNDNKVSGSGIYSGTATVVGSHIVASGTAGRQVLYGASLSATGSSYTIGMGNYGTIGSNSVAVANGPNFTKFNVGANAVGIGVGLSSVANNSIAIGYGANTTSQRSIQLGEGSTTDAYQLNVFGKNVLSGSNYTLNRDRIPYLNEYETKVDAATEHTELSNDLTAWVEEHYPKPEPTGPLSKLTIRRNDETLIEYDPEYYQPQSVQIFVPTKVQDLDDGNTVVRKDELSTELSDYATVSFVNDSFNNASTYTDEQISGVRDSLSDYCQISDDYATEQYVQDYVAQHGGGSTGEISACLSSLEFENIDPLSGDITSYALSTYIAKLNEVIYALKRYTPPPHVVTGTTVTYTDNTVQTYEIVGELNKNNLPNYSTVKNIHIGSTVTSIGEKLFRDNTNLTSITFEEGIQEIKKEGLQNTHITEISIPSSMLSLDIDAFHSSKLVDVTVPGTVKYIGPSAFRDIDTLQRLYISDGVETIEDSFCFDSGDSVSSLSVRIPSYITEIKHDAFNGCEKLKNFIIPSACTTIGNVAFYYCSNYTPDLVVPSTVTSIGNNAFYYFATWTNAKIIFDGRTTAQVQAMSGYPWGADTSKIQGSL